MVMPALLAVKPQELSSYALANGAGHCLTASSSVLLDSKWTLYDNVHRSLFVEDISYPLVDGSGHSLTTSVSLLSLSGRCITMFRSRSVLIPVYPLHQVILNLLHNSGINLRVD